MKNLRLGVVGVGHIGKNHARLYAEIGAADFTAIYDTDAATAAQIAQQYHVRAADSLEEFAELIDAVGVPVLSRGEDIANARLRFENGCVANITSSRISPERMRKIRVFQEDAYLSLDYQNQTGEIYRKVGGGIERAEVEIEKEEPLKRQILSFIECARTGLRPKVSGFEATAALELAVEITKRIQDAPFAKAQEKS